MSQVFEGYERQYCELSVNLSRKCSSAGPLPAGGNTQLLPSLNQLCQFSCYLLFEMFAKVRFF